MSEQLYFLQRKASRQLTKLHDYISKAAGKPIHCNELPAKHSNVTKENEGHVEHKHREIIVYADPGLEGPLLETVIAHELLHVALELDGFAHELRYDGRRFHKAEWVPTFVNGLLDSLDHLLINPMLSELGFPINTLTRKHQQKWLREIQEASRQGKIVNSAVTCMSACRWLQWRINGHGVKASVLRRWFSDWLPEALELGEKWAELVLARGYATPSEQADSLAAILSTCRYREMPLLQLFAIAPLCTISSVSHRAWMGRSVLEGVRLID
jgi:hypothetical protein